MDLDPNTIGIVLSLLLIILKQVNKTIDKSKNRKETGTESFRAEGVTSDPDTWIAELKVVILQQVESVKLLTEQHVITIDALRDKAAWLERRLRCMAWLASIGSAVVVAALSLAL